MTNLLRATAMVRPRTQRSTHILPILLRRDMSRRADLRRRLATGAFAHFASRARQGLRRMRARARQRLAGTHTLWPGMYRNYHVRV